METNDQSKRKLIAPKVVLLFIITSLTILGLTKFTQNIIQKRKTNPLARGLSSIPAEGNMRLEIPTINVNSRVEYLGLTNGGTMDTTDDLENVAWFNLGPYPGEIGNAVIVGHQGWKDRVPGVFNNLDKLLKGDKIYIVDENGIKISFVVRESKTYLNSSSAVELFSSNDEKSHLNLVTCSGTWNESNKSYSDRLVVFADKEESNI